jgi:RNA recognition motif-containing protein
MDLIVLGLPRNINEDELTPIFKNYGEVTSCTIVLDKNTGTSKGFGFVSMKNDEEAKVAISALHGTKVNKNKIRVKQAEKQE